MLECVKFFGKIVDIEGTRATSIKNFIFSKSLLLEIISNYKKKLVFHKAIQLSAIFDIYLFFSLMRSFVDLA